ncbi:MAG: hypothetical protein QNL12_12250 [Acidimicrobiia bacterium]|nr:hypothetical protein [Acidimicrobiia bacterium]MDX2468080.1 hypothetical protein [Acidimicrobiia bacterium]
MGNRGGLRPTVTAAVAVVLFITSCTSSDETQDNTTSTGPQPPATTATTVVVDGAVEPDVVVADLKWESLNGPPGGSAGMVAQDPFTGTVYTVSAAGLYQTTNQGESWTKVSRGAVSGVTSLAFGRHGTYACSSLGLVLLQRDGSEVPVGAACITVAVDDEWLYAANSSEGRDELRVEMLRTPIGDVPLTPDNAVWTDVTPDHAAIASRARSEAAILSVDDLVIAGESVLATVAIGDASMMRSSDASQVFLSLDQGDSWQPVDPGFDEPLVVQKLKYDENSGLLFALAHVDQTDGPFFPLADLVRVSRDHGQTWEVFTEIRDVMSPTVGDVDVRDDRYVLSNVDFALAELDRTDPNRLLGRGQPPVSGFTAGYVFEELVFDVTVPGVVYVRPYLRHEGVARSTDGGETWEASMVGIVSAPVGNINVHPTDPNTMVASGNLGYPAHLSTDGGATWTMMAATGSMADEVAFDPHDPDHLLFMSELTDVFESLDGGVTWSHPADAFSANRVHSISLSADQDTLFSANLGTNISSIVGLIPGDEHPIGLGENAWFNMLNSPDYAYAIETAPDGAVFASYSPKKFEDFGAVWRYRGGPDGDPEGWEEVLRIPGASGVTDLIVGPGDPYTVYAGVTGQDPGLWASSDAGDTWNSVHTDGFDFVTVHAVAIDPGDPDVVYAAPWGDGLYRSADGGESWVQLDTPTVSVAAIVVDPLESSHLIIGDRTRPIVWESWDSGLTWGSLFEFDDGMHYRVMSLAKTDEGIYVSLLDRVPEGLAIFAGVPESGSNFRIGLDGPHPIEGLTRSVLSFSDQGDAVFAVTHLSGVYEIVNDVAIDISAGLPDMGFNNVLAREGGVLVAGGSDIDTDFQFRIGDPAVVHNIYRWAGAGTWEPLLEGDPFNSPIKQLLRHGETGALIAATGSGVYVSDPDGTTWARASDGLDFGEIGAIAMVDDTIVAGTLGGGATLGTVRAAPNGSVAIEWRPSAGPRSEIANIRLAVDPTDPARLWASSYPGGVYTSRDNGATWTESNFGIPSFEVADPVLQGYYSLVVDPTRADRLYLSIYEHGVFVSDNGAATWRPLGPYGGNQDLMKAGLTALAIDGQGRLWLATDDRGVFVTTDGGANWEPVNDGLATAQILALETAASGAVFAGTAGYGVYMLAPGDTTWQHLGATIGMGEWAPWDRRLYQYGSFLFDPVIEDRVYLGHFPGGFFASEDGGRSWRSSNTGMGNDGIFSLTVHPENPDTIFAGTYNGIIRSDDRGSSWYDTSEGMPAEQWPFSVVIDDANPSLMYTATKNGQNKGFCGRNLESFCGTVMRSVDGGANWLPITEGLPVQAEYYMVVIDPRDHDVLYLSSSRGVHVSADAGETWTLMNLGLPDIEEFIVRDNVAHNMELTPDGKSLVLAVVGYGIYRAELPELTEK